MKILYKSFYGDFEGCLNLPHFPGKIRTLQLAWFLVICTSNRYKNFQFSSSEDCRTDEKDPRSQYLLAEAKNMQMSQIRSL